VTGENNTAGAASEGQAYDSMSVYGEVRAYTEEESKQAYQDNLTQEEKMKQAAIEAAMAEYEILKRNTGTYRTYTEEEIMEAEADLDILDSLAPEPSASPVAQQELSVTEQLEGIIPNVMESATDNTSDDDLP